MASNSQGNSNAPAISQTERDSINKSYQSFVELHKMHHARPLYVLQNQIQDSACVHTTALRPAGPVSLLDALLKGKTPQTVCFIQNLCTVV
jgi:acyl-CoA hydrolase